MKGFTDAVLHGRPLFQPAMLGECPSGGSSAAYSAQFVSFVCVDILIFVSFDRDLLEPFAAHVFTVSAVETEASVRCRLEGHFYLLVGPRGLSLASRGQQGAMGKVLFWWPFCNIRRYGMVQGAFSFEAGRKCASGEGLFTWRSPEAADIHRAMVDWLKVSLDSAVAHSQEVEQHCYENLRPGSSVEHVQCNDAEYAVIRKSSAAP